MNQKQTHKDVEFCVLALDGTYRYYRSFDKACAFALAKSLCDGEWHDVSVLITSEGGAKWWGGDISLEMYREDPEASISHQIAVKAEDRGRIA